MIKLPLFPTFENKSREFSPFPAYAQNAILRNDKFNSLLNPTRPAAVLRDHYVKELQAIKDRKRQYNTFPHYLFPDY